MSRDWLKSLFKASFRGAHFWVEADAESGGRRVVVHQFPMRDDPYNEDLGEDKREFSVTAYVASDAADREAASLTAACAMRGASTLVLPTHGPILVRCLTFSRDRQKDQHGKIAFSLKFVREGAVSALVTVSSLANMIFVNADVLAASAAAAMVRELQLNKQPDFVVDSAVQAARDVSATLDAVRTTSPVDPAVSAAQRNEIQSIYDDTETAIADPALAARIIAAARALGDAMPPASAVAAFPPVIAETAVATATAYLSAGAKAAAANTAAAYRLGRIAALTAYCEAIARIELKDRPAGISLRGAVAEYFEREIYDVPASEAELYVALSEMRAAVISYLSQVILNLAPVITVSAAFRMPSLFWAWRLYSDPLRGGEVAARNRVPHPSFIPRDFEALAR